jgi:ABC-type hemin transport system ATPase subunit
VNLKFGSSEARLALAFQPGAVTVFVGPNNSGESLLLREVEAYAQQGLQAERKILENFEPHLPTAADARRLLLSRQQHNVKPAKYHWVPKVFELMGSDPSNPSYLKPHEGDVWAFVKKVGE